MGVSFYGLSNNSYYVQLFIRVDSSAVYARIALLSAGLLYVFLPSVRTYTVRGVVHMTGALLIVLGIVSIFLPIAIGATAGNILLGDSISLVFVGASSIILGSELSARRSRVFTASMHYIRSMLTTARPEGVVHAKEYARRKTPTIKTSLGVVPFKKAKIGARV